MSFQSISGVPTLAQQLWIQATNQTDDSGSDEDDDNLEDEEGPNHRPSGFALKLKRGYGFSSLMPNATIEDINACFHGRSVLIQALVTHSFAESRVAALIKGGARASNIPQLPFEEHPLDLCTDLMSLHPMTPLVADADISLPWMTLEDASSYWNAWPLGNLCTTAMHKKYEDLLRDAIQLLVPLGVSTETKLFVIHLTTSSLFSFPISHKSIDVLVLYNRYPPPHYEPMMDDSKLKNCRYRIGDIIGILDIGNGGRAELVVTADGTYQKFEPLECSYRMEDAIASIVTDRAIGYNGVPCMRVHFIDSRTCYDAWIFMDSNRIVPAPPGSF
jgi:hypothetical protein